MDDCFEFRMCHKHGHTHSYVEHMLRGLWNGTHPLSGRVQGQLLIAQLEKATASGLLRLTSSVHVPLVY